jgi:secreted PhoX family phosphatase
MSELESKPTLTNQTTPTRRFLPLLGDGHSGGNRTSVTCIYRCGNACAHPAPNISDNEYFGDIAQPVMSRRGLLQTAGLGALVIGTVGTVGVETAAAKDREGPTRSRPAAGSPLSFTAVPANTLDTLLIPNGYSPDVVIRWGDPVLPGAPVFDVDNQTARSQAAQFGYNCDFVWFMPLPGRDNRALLVVNHEYTNEPLMFRDYVDGATATLQHVRVAQMAHGLSVVEIEREIDGDWRPVRRGRVNRRITTDTPMRLTGPAAGSPWLRTADDPTGRTVLGTLNNCAGGTTLWGTILTCEENFHQYFAGANGAPEAAKPRLARYGFPTTTYAPSGYRGWERYEERFNLTKHPNEASRFGYVVEIDPYDPDFVPRKRTALGRFKHEGADVSLTADRRVVIYMGDDERFDYLYKFVSTNKFRSGHSRSARRHNLTLLDEGTLYVAKFTGDSLDEIDGTGKLPADGAFDGTGVWLPLASDKESYIRGMSAAEVFVFTREAADKAGATKMDRPEEVQRHPGSGSVYAALTNNDRRGTANQPQADEPNPRRTNRHGQILEIVENNNDGAALSFSWNLPIVCGDPADPSTYFAGYDKTKVSPISCPDNLGFDKAGNLWIATDGNALGSNDGFFAVPLEGAERGHLKQFLTVPFGAEACGLCFTPDMKALFVAVQHPGEVDGATVDNPASTWPDGDYGKPSVAVVWRSAPGSKRIGA